MTSRRLVKFSIAPILAVLLAGCASKHFAAGPNEEILGTWIAQDGMQKTEVKADGTRRLYIYSDDTMPALEETYTLVEKWKDPDTGAIFYRAQVTQTGPACFATLQEYNKISHNGTIWESVDETVGSFDPRAYPRTIDPSNPNYTIRSRTLE